MWYDITSFKAKRVLNTYTPHQKATPFQAICISFPIPSGMVFSTTSVVNTSHGMEYRKCYTFVRQWLPEWFRMWSWNIGFVYHQNIPKVQLKLILTVGGRLPKISVITACPLIQYIGIGLNWKLYWIEKHTGNDNSFIFIHR